MAGSARQPLLRPGWCHEPPGGSTNTVGPARWPTDRYRMLLRSCPAHVTVNQQHPHKPAEHNDVYCCVPCTKSWGDRIIAPHRTAPHRIALPCIALSCIAQHCTAGREGSHLPDVRREPALLASGCLGVGIPGGQALPDVARPCPCAAGGPVQADGSAPTTLLCPHTLVPWRQGSAAAGRAGGGWLL